MTTQKQKQDEMYNDTTDTHKNAVRGVCGTNKTIVENETGYGNFAEPSKRTAIRSEDVLLYAIEKCERLKAQVEQLQQELLSVKENRKC